MEDRRFLEFICRIEQRLYGAREVTAGSPGPMFDWGWESAMRFARKILEEELAKENGPKIIEAAAKELD